ncbi:hypothetical protein ACJX0J_016881, partial [Zea mays]
MHLMEGFTFFPPLKQSGPGLLGIHHFFFSPHHEFIAFYDCFNCKKKLKDDTMNEGHKLNLINIRLITCLKHLTWI